MLWINDQLLHALDCWNSVGDGAANIILNGQLGLDYGLIYEILLSFYSSIFSTVFITQKYSIVF